MELVYIAGAISATRFPRGLHWLEVFLNRLASVKYTRQLMRQGMATHTPHLQTLLFGHALDYEHILAHDLGVMAHCDIIAFMPNWVRSNGARKEMDWAIANGKRIIFLE